MSEHWKKASELILSRGEKPPAPALSSVVLTVYEENQRYFADKKKETAMVEHWVPPEDRTWQSTTTPKPGKSQKVKEVPTKEAQKKSCVATNLPTGVTKMAAELKSKTGSYLTMARTWYAKLRANKVAPIHTKVQSRHLELEPLCCLSSCLVRGGCMTVVVFEAIMCYIAYTLFFILIGMSRDGFTLWEPLPKNFNGWFGHHFFYYCIAFYDIALFIVAAGLARGLYTFDRFLLKMHFYFCFVSLAVNLLFLAFTTWFLSSPGDFTFNLLNSLLIWCFAMQIPLQIWAVTVVKSCYDFFGLIHVFVTLAES